jgi:hypothetical protein
MKKIPLKSIPLPPPEGLLNPRDVTIPFLPLHNTIKNTGIAKRPRPLQYHTAQIGGFTEYIYHGKYIPRDVVNQCYRKGEITNVNKTDTGNGFTSSVLNTPPEYPLVKILIEPNLKVIEDKAKTYTGANYLYLHSLSFSTLNDWTNETEFIVTTTDTFRYIILPALRLNGQAKLVESITIDELHKVPEGANFRNSLVDYFHKVSLEMLKLNPDIAIVNVTASAPLSTNPFYYFNGFDPAHGAGQNPYKIDIRIAPIVREKVVIHRNNDEVELVKEIKELLANGERVMVFTNQIDIILQFVEKKILKAKLIAGQSVSKVVYHKAVVEPNEKFIISTSSGFEGWDANEEGWNIYLFSDSNESKYTIGVNHTEQGIGRARKGAKKITFCEVPFYQTKEKFGNVRKLTTAFDEIERLKERDNFRPIDLIKKKLHRDRNIKKSREIVNSAALEYELKDGLSVLLPRPILEQLYADHEETERRMRSIADPMYIDQYWGIKNIEFIDDNLKVNRVGGKKLLRSKKCLEANKDLIIESGLHETPLKMFGKTPEDLVNAFKWWIKFRELTPVTAIKSKKVERFLEAVTIQDENVELTYHTKQIEAFLATLIKERTKSVRKELKKAERRKNNDAEIKTLKDKIERVEKGYFSMSVMTLIALLLNDPKDIDTDTPLNVYREYNLTTKLDMNTIQKVCDWLGVEVTELDIRSCAWRIMYAVLGLPLPDKFYGENKKNKGRLNKVLNQLSASAKTKESKKQLNEFKNEMRTRLKDLGVPLNVRNWLVETFAEKPRDEVFNLYTYHENNIIQQVTNAFPQWATIIRRHDSILVFDFDWESVTGQVAMERVKEFEYLNQKGWFFEEVKKKDSDVQYNPPPFCW